MIFRRIDLETLRPHPHAFATSTPVQFGIDHISVCGGFRVKLIMDQLGNEAYCIARTDDYTRNGPIFIKGEWRLQKMDEALMRRLIAAKAGVLIRYNTQIISHAPEPSHTFQYERLDVECRGCHARFDFSELKEFDGDDGFNDEVCPVCGEWSCLEDDNGDSPTIILETIEAALRRKSE
jgi:hypothetical protein